MTEGLRRVELIGRVIGRPRIIIGADSSCHFDIRVTNDEGGFDPYEVVITEGRKPWALTEGIKVSVIGILRGKTLFADYFSKCRREE